MWYLLGVLVVVALGALYGFIEHGEPGDDAWLDVLRWLDTFIRSPGLGGFAAVVAASVAFGQWRRQQRAERKARRDQQWWDVLKLVYPDSATRAGAPTDEERALVDTLAEQADTEVQTAAAIALIGNLERRAAAAGEPPRGEVRQWLTRLIGAR